MTAVLAVDRRHDRDAEVDRASPDAQLEAPVLRDALLGDVELRHDLDARDDGAVVPLVDRLHRLVEHAVDPVLDDDDVLLRLDVDVRGAALDRVEDDRVDELDDRRRVLRDPIDREGLFALLVLGHELHAELFGRLVEHALGGLALLKDVVDRRAAADLELQRESGQKLQLVELHDVGGIGADDRERFLRALLRDERVAQHPFDRNRPEELGVHADGRDVDVRQTQTLGESLRVRLPFDRGHERVAVDTFDDGRHFVTP